MARTMGVPESLRRCLAAPGFVERFLALVTQRLPERSGDAAPADAGVLRMTTQRCLTTLVLAVAGVVPPAEFEARFRECICPGGPGMTPDTYIEWADALMTAVRETDPHMDAELAGDWQAALAAGARLLGTRLHGPLSG
jgi:hypothetical protein